MISGIYKQNGTTQDAMTIVETRGGGAFGNNADPVCGDSETDGQSERSVHDSYGFCCSASTTARTIGFQREIAASLRGNNTHDGTVLIEKKNE